MKEFFCRQILKTVELFFHSTNFFELFNCHQQNIILQTKKQFINFELLTKKFDMKIKNVF